MNIKIHQSWQRALEEHLRSDGFQTLAETVRAHYLDNNKTIYPPPKDLFRAFNKTPFDKVKAVILGQDPYHNHGQANGLCFSVPNGVPAPPSLLNIFQEIKQDTGKARTNTDLADWAEQGVFLLNSVLTVLKNQPASHANIGWEEFTDSVIKTTSDKRECVVFMLWGAYARSKAGLINSDKHLVLEAPHPSPLSAHRGFLGCKHFTKANEYLKIHGLAPIKW